MNIILLGIIIVESAVLLLLAVRGELTLQKKEQTKKPVKKIQLPEKKEKPSTPYDRVLEFCDQELLPVYEFEKINLIPIGTIEKWKTQKPDLKYLTKAALYMKVSPFWLETGKPANNITVREEFILYILRHMDDEHYRKIVNSSIHEAFTIFEIDK